MLNLNLYRVRNEKIDCHRFSGLASQCVEWVDPNIEQVKKEALGPFFSSHTSNHLRFITVIAERSEATNRGSTRGTGGSCVS